MPLGSLLLPSIGKSGAILTICMALHQAVKTTGKSTESRPPYPCETRDAVIEDGGGLQEPYSATSCGPSLLTSSPRKTQKPPPPRPPRKPVPLPRPRTIL